MHQDEFDRDLEQRIRLRALEIWESEGRPIGRHEEHWRQAQRELGDIDASAGRIDPDRAADAAPGPLGEGDDLRQRQEQLLDEAIEETFPGSDPISPKHIT